MTMSLATNAGLPPKMAVTMVDVNNFVAIYLWSFTVVIHSSAFKIVHAGRTAWKTDVTEVFQIFKNILMDFFDHSKKMSIPV